MYSFNTKKFALLMANKRYRYLLRDTIAIGGIFASALLIAREEEQKESKIDENKLLHSQRIMEQGSISMTSSTSTSTAVVSTKTADYLFVPQYDLLRGMFSSPLFSNVTACDSAFKPPPNTHIQGHQTSKIMENAATKKKLRSKYNVKWKRILGEGGFGAVYLGKEKKSGEFRFVFRFFVYSYRSNK
jgi:hypothetical protein